MSTPARCSQDYKWGQLLWWRRRLAPTLQQLVVEEAGDGLAAWMFHFLVLNSNPDHVSFRHLATRPHIYGQAADNPQTPQRSSSRRAPLHTATFGLPVLLTLQVATVATAQLTAQQLPRSVPQGSRFNRFMR